MLVVSRPRLSTTEFSIPMDVIEPGTPGVPNEPVSLHCPLPSEPVPEPGDPYDRSFLSVMPWEHLSVDVHRNEELPSNTAVGRLRSVLGLPANQCVQRFPGGTAAVVLVILTVHLCTRPDSDPLPTDLSWTQWGYACGALAVPPADASWWWRTVTHMAVHTTPWHVTVHLVALAVFGTLSECRHGTAPTYTTFLAGGCTSSMTALLVGVLSAPASASLVTGSAGATYALIAVYMADPWYSHSPLPRTGVYYGLLCMALVGLVAPWWGWVDQPFERTVGWQRTAGSAFGLLVAVGWMPRVNWARLRQRHCWMTAVGNAWFLAVQPVWLIVLLPGTHVGQH